MINQKLNKFMRVLLILSVFGCGNDVTIKKYALEGNWSYLEINSLEYYEVTIDSNSMSFYHLDGGFLPLKNYKLNNDTLYMKYNKKLEYGKPYIVSGSVNNLSLLNEDTGGLLVKMERIDSNEITIDRVIQNDDENHWINFEVGFLNRKNKLLGIDTLYSYDDVKKMYESNESIEDIETLKTPNE